MFETKRIAISLLILLVAGCDTYHEIESTDSGESKPIDCSMNSPQPYEMVVPTIPNTGVQRKAPINIVSRKDFITALNKSNLWKFLEDKFEKNEDYTDTFTFVNTEGNIRILGEKQLYNITYSFNNILKRREYGHLLTNIEKNQITDMINLVVGSREKSEIIFNKLYSSYLKKVKNNELLDDNRTYHSYVIDDDIIYEMWGIREVDHPIKECHFDMLEKVTIS